MPSGILLQYCTDISLSDCGFVGCETGVTAIGCYDLKSSNNKFERCGVGFDISQTELFSDSESKFTECGTAYRVENVPAHGNCEMTENKPKPSSAARFGWNKAIERNWPFFRNTK